jgi:hypothetical protein
MKMIVIKIVIILVAVVSVALVAAMFTRKKYNIYREITINKPAPEVFNYLRYLKNHDHFNKWAMIDPNKKKSFTGTDGTVGFVYAYDGNKEAGAGELEIKELKENELINIETRFKRPFENVGESPYTLQAVAANQTKVRWGMNSELKYPMNMVLWFLDVDKVFGKDIQTSLVTLKSNLEK